MARTLLRSAGRSVPTLRRRARGGSWPCRSDDRPSGAPCVADVAAPTVTLAVVTGQDPGQVTTARVRTLRRASSPPRRSGPLRDRAARPAPHHRAHAQARATASRCPADTTPDANASCRAGMVAHTPARAATAAASRVVHASTAGQQRSGTFTVRRGRRARWHVSEMRTSRASSQLRTDWDCCTSSARVSRSGWLLFFCP